MKKLLYSTPHIITLGGLLFSVLAAAAVIDGRFDAAARLSLLVLLVDRIDGTLARKLNVSTRFPNTSGEILDIITDLVGLTFVPMLLFWRTELFIPGSGLWLAGFAAAVASWKYARKESFLGRGYSVGAPPIFFSLFLFYFLELPPILATLYAVILIILVISPVKYPITSLVTTHWKFGFKSVTNYLTALFFVPVFIWLGEAPAVIYWLMLLNILIQLFAYPLLLKRGIIKPVFDRNA